MGLGEYLLHETVEQLHQEIPSLQTFATLSPIPNFRRWMEAATEEAQWITKEDRKVLGVALSCPPEVAVPTLFERLRNLDEQPLLTSLPNVQAVMLRWAAHYLYIEKHRRKPLDRVARFHVGNGAILDQLHWGADLSRKGWQSSFGIMVTYRYDLVQLSLNQSNFESNDIIAVGGSFSQHIP
jgi:malonyl-CoA decarboxylase